MFEWLTSPARLPMVAPSILAADFARLGEEARSALDAGGDFLHLDIMDGHFVPNLSMGPSTCAAVRRLLPDARLDVHLMVDNPEMFFEPFARAGADNISFHVETLPPDERAGEVMRRIGVVHDLGCSAGLAINPQTALDPEVQDLFRHADLALVMSVVPGFGGQRFMDGVLDKVRLLRDLLDPSTRIEIDGGIDGRTARRAVEGGAELLVAGSAIFGHPQDERAERIREIRGS